jgi:hypothetical protein
VGRSGARADRVRFLVPEGSAEPCRLLPLGAFGPELRSVEVRIRRGDGPGSRAGTERVVPRVGPTGPTQALWLPELVGGEIVSVRVRAAAPGDAWDPGAWGPAAWARLRASGAGACGADDVGPVADPAARPLCPAPPALPLAGIPAKGLIRAQVNLSVDPDAQWAVREPPPGLTRIRYSTDVPPGSHRQVLWPPGSVERGCTGQASAAGCALGPGPGGWWYELPRLLIADGLRADELGADRVDAEIVAPGVELWVADAAGGLRAASGGATLWTAAPAAAPPGLEPAPEVGLSWRIGAARGREVLPDRSATLEALALRAFAASLPEPGLPAHLKGRTDGDRVVVDLLDHHRAEARIDSLPGSALSPRPLVEARRSGVRTEWESALTLAMQLRQLKRVAEPVPVRPPALGPAVDPAHPGGHVAALVRLEGPQGDVWIDPACSSCAPGVIRAALQGGAALAQGAGVVPELRPAALSVAEDGEHREVRAEGVPADELRAALRASPPEGRARVAAAWAGGERLLAHEGLEAPGGAVVLRVLGTADQREGNWELSSLEIPQDLAASARWPWPGAWERTWGAPATARPCRAEAQVGAHRVVREVGGGRARERLERPADVHGTELAELAAALADLRARCPDLPEAAAQGHPSAP